MSVAFLCTAFVLPPPDSISYPELVIDLLRKIQRPALFAVEVPRCAAEFAAGLALAPMLARAAPRGDGHAVLVIPGWLAADPSTLFLRCYLRHLGYRVYGWGQHPNHGPTVATVAALREKLQRMALGSGGRVSVIGWSLGGLYAYELARRKPSLVRQVITLSTPVASRSRTQRFASHTVEALAHRHLLPGPTPRAWLEAGSLRVPVTAIHSRTDAIAPWQKCLIPEGVNRRNIEVRSSHLGLGHHPGVLRVIGDRLAKTLPS